MAAYYTTFPALALCVPRIRGTPAVRRSGPSRIPARADTGVRRQGDSIYFLSDAKSAKRRLDFPKSRPRFVRAFGKSSAHRGAAAEIGKARAKRGLLLPISRRILCALCVPTCQFHIKKSKCCCPAYIRDFTFVWLIRSSGWASARRSPSAQPAVLSTCHSLR